MTDSRDATPPRRIPLWVKLLYTAFVVVLVSCYWHDYGPTNFLYFCDVAAFFALGAVWLEWPILASMPAVGILLPQALWMVDFLAALCGVNLTGLTAYMFDSSIPTFTRALSLFHFWLPIFLVWLIWRLGYDRRALLAWTLSAWLLLFMCYFWMPAPPAPADNPSLPVNINYVYGLSDKGPQTWMPEPVYFALLMLVLPCLIFIPTHYALAWFARQRPAGLGSERHKPGK